MSEKSSSIYLSEKTKLIMPISFIITLVGALAWITYQWAFFKPLPQDVRALKEEVRVLSEQNENICDILSVMTANNHQVNFIIRCTDKKIKFVPKELARIQAKRKINTAPSDDNDDNDTSSKNFFNILKH